MKRLNPAQVSRIARKTSSIRYELMKLYESLDITTEDIMEPAILNSFYQIKMAALTLETFHDNCYQVFHKQLM